MICVVSRKVKRQGSKARISGVGLRVSALPLTFDL
jgi:hypothetical protein